MSNLQKQIVEATNEVALAKLLQLMNKPPEEWNYAETAFVSSMIGRTAKIVHTDDDQTFAEMTNDDLLGVFKTE